jgi:hypothetical protein
MKRLARVVLALAVVCLIAAVAVPQAQAGHCGGGGGLFGWRARGHQGHAQGLFRARGLLGRTRLFDGDGRPLLRSR